MIEPEPQSKNLFTDDSVRPQQACADKTDKPDVASLSPEEQLARFEQELKENDWGHQPC